MELSGYFQRVEESAEWLVKRAGLAPAVTVVLSAGLGGFVDGLEDRVEIPSAEIPHFPQARAEGHAGSVAFGIMKGVPIVVLCGRFHFYEGHAPHEVVFPHFVFEKLGSGTLITTNAVGGIKKSFRAGDIMLISDHINLMAMNPLVGIAAQRPADQFTSLLDAYDADLRAIARRVARGLGFPLREGVYLAVSGPSYETKAEVAAFRKMGADAVGMSTVPEVIAARFLGMRVLSLSCVANAAADLHRGEMTHSEVLEAMGRLAPRAVWLLEGIVEEIGRAL
jgi:purine-nucleoside phosphorylase